MTTQPPRICCFAPRSFSERVRAIFAPLDAAVQHIHLDTWSATPIADEADLILWYVDIAQTAFHSSLKYLRAGFPEIPLIILAEPAAEEQVAEVLGDGVTDYVLTTPAQLKRLPHLVQRAIEHRRLQAQLLAADAELQLSQRSMAAVNDGLVPVEVEAALRESQERFAGIVGAAMDAIISIDAAQRIVVFNTAAEQMFGCAAAEAIGQPVGRFIPARFRGVHATHIQIFGQTGISSRSMRSPGTLTALRADGTEFPIEATIAQTMARAQPLYTVIMRDISARLQAEAALQESEQRYRQIVETAQEGIWQIDASNRITFVNAKMADIIGYSMDEVIGASLFDFMDAEGQASATAHTERQHQGIAEQYDFKFRRKDGVDVWTLISANPMLDRAGNYTGSLVMITDITGRKRDEQELRLSEARFATAFRASPIAMSITTLTDGRFLDINTSHELIFGYARDELIGQSADAISIYADPRQRAEVVRIIRSHGSLRDTELTLRTKSGELREVLCSLETIEVNGEACILGSVFDITARKQAEAALRLSEERLRAVTDTAQVGLVIVDQEHRYRYANPAYTAIFHLGAIDLVGRRVADVLSSVYDTQIRPRLERAFAGERVTYELTLPPAGAGGQESHYAVRYEPGDYGSTTVVVVVVMDITERKRAEQAVRKSEQLYRTLARNLPNGSVLLFDQQLRFTIADGSALSDTGLSREGVEGRTLAEVLPPASVAQLEPLYRAALSGTRSELQVEAGERIYQSHFLPVPDERGAIIAGMVMSYEITELKRIERELREERAQLTRKVAERTADLSLANAELARAARLKDEFLANMSHELRTPLNSILGRAEALQEAIYGAITPKQEEVLRGLEESGRHLLSLISDILDLSKIEAGQLDLALHPVDIDLICHTSLRMVAQLALTKQVTLNSTIDTQVETIQADERRLKQILVNLLSNAVKFTPAGGKVRLEVGSDPERQTVTFTVSDTGIGIAEEHLAKLFQPFVQIDSSLSRQYEGTGLGLALVMRLVEAHGGSVAVESAPGLGSSFSVALPWVPEVTRVRLSGEARVPKLGVPAIQHALVVEDSASAARQLARYLRELGAEVEILGQGTATVARAVALQPNVIILDVLLPGQTGWDVIQALKAEPRTRAIPVVVVSVMDEPARVIELGAAAFLLKPISRTAFMETVLQVVQPAATLQRQPALTVASDTARPRILLAEDNQANIDVLSDYLQTHGYEVIVARNGVEAVTAVQGERMALILMDIQMPGMDGLEAIRRLRANPDTQDVPIIALTALAMPGDRERCLEAGANVYLAKPLNLRALLTTIRSQLGNATAL